MKKLLIPFLILILGNIFATEFISVKLCNRSNNDLSYEISKVDYYKGFDNISNIPTEGRILKQNCINWSSYDDSFLSLNIVKFKINNKSFFLMNPSGSERPRITCSFTKNSREGFLEKGQGVYDLEPFVRSLNNHEKYYDLIFNIENDMSTNWEDLKSTVGKNDDQWSKQCNIN